MGRALYKSQAEDPPKAGLTHSGVFHADDVFATALLVTLNPDIAIVRSDSVPVGFEGVAYDVGGGPFDHHRERLRRRSNGVPYASFGLLWERYGHLLVDDKDDAQLIDRELVQPIDLTDNTGVGNPLSRCVADFNPFPGAPKGDYDDAFWDAVTWARGVIERRVASVRHARMDVSYVSQRMAECDGCILVFDRPVMWKRTVVGSTYEYVVYPSLRGGYNVQCVPVSMDDQTPVKAFPQEWWGGDARELQRITSVEDFTFCHHAGFLCAANSLVGALKIANLAANHERGE